MMNWSNWEKLEIATPFSEGSLRETLDGGQAFRWTYRKVDQCWEGIWGHQWVQLRLGLQGGLEFRVPQSISGSCAPAIREYFLLEDDWDHLTDQLPWRSDAALRSAIDAFRGLRLLNQPFPETLLCFMCSATKQIPQIKVMCDNLARQLGDPIVEGGPHALPTWQQLADTSEIALRSLGLGFRARNIKKTADLIATSAGILERIESMPYEGAKAELLAFPGVGSKIADCALLFGARKYDAFPVDTWILKVLEKRYGLAGWKKDQLECFGRVHLGPYAGYAQQYLFAYERSQRR